MASAIDPDVPPFGLARTRAVRDNFQAAQLEITTLQATAGAVAQPGMLFYWAGSAGSVPAGYIIVGEGRFIVGSGGAYADDDTGGSDSVTLTATQIPVHTHTIVAGGAHTHTVTTASNGNHSHTGTTSLAGAHTHTVNSAASTATNVEDAGSTGGYRGANQAASTDPAGAHTHTASTSTDANHTHTATSVANVDHTHTVPANGVGSAYDNRPKYINLLLITLDV